MAATGLRYAVHAYAWTSSWSNADLPIIDHVRELGLDAVEIPLMEPDKVDPAAIAARAQACGLEVLTSLALPEHADPSSEDKDVRRRGLELLTRCIDLTANMGASVFTGVVYSAIGRRIDRRVEEADYERAAEVLKAAARHAQGRSVTIGLEPINRYETFLVNTAAQARRLLELIDEPNVGIHLDAYHMNIEEEDFYETTLSVVPHLVHFHLSESHRGIPGRGTVDWDAIMRALADGGYAGFVGLESFVDIAEAMRAATYVWRQLAPDSDTLVSEGLAYLKGLEAKYAA
ncbi:Sugar phosphate isomerase/epimerase [Gaiella occulta]|uniref:Sugar phosphate isomerase/epimerase n=1 Tax=Gaiella occulta TaxID=1002870 RepID=A0A7M2Z111_9ACTN|nr:sugar phosphate isomerase/epimerase family protein [Gaiella occulta]RDI75809.1 Sugar phosphate isomerase/epimerase [Gaiella occulta]